jgi:hypothetical protein
VRYRRRRRDAVQGLWDRFAGRMGEARDRFAESYVLRREALADWFWVRWEHVVDRVGAARETLAEWFWTRWDRVAGAPGRFVNRSRDRATRSPSGRGQRSGTRHAVVATALVGALAIAVTFAILQGAGGPDRTRVVPRDADVVDMVPRVPDVRGMSALDARALLERVGLRIERSSPIAGTPGEVVATVPAIGGHVPRGTSITLLVGAEADRIHPSTSSTELPSDG